MLKVHAFVRENVPKVLSHNKEVGKKTVMFLLK